jgi:hypothetical protein
MQQVEESLRSGPSYPSVETAPCIPRTIGEGLHNQVELRALAEQLVCEGNAVLRSRGLSLELIDTPDIGRLGFTLVCGRCRAWVVTDVVGRSARARLDAPILGSGEREIAGPEALAGLLISLIDAERASRGSAV